MLAKDIYEGSYSVVGLSFKINLFCLYCLDGSTNKNLYLQTFDDLLRLAETGDHRKVDMLVKDIYGGSYSVVGLPGDVIASSFGKAARSPKDTAGMLL